MTKLRAGIFVLLGLALVAWFTATYTINEYEQVLRTRFGEIRGAAVTEPGLHFKVPLVDRIHVFDNRWLRWDGAPNQIPTRDKKYIWVDTYARWKISDPVLFYKRLHDETGAQSRLDDIIDGEIRNVIANHELIELVRSSSREFELGELGEMGEIDPADFQVEYGRETLRERVVEKASTVMPEYGIELADVRVKRINYVESVQQKVFERMISERKRIAERYRSEGQGKSAEIRGKLERELKTIQSKAKRKATEIRGEGDAEATTIYAEAYELDPQFYAFLKTLETYQKTIAGQTTLVLSTNSDFLRFLDSSEPGD